MIDKAIPSDKNARKKEYENLEKYQRLKEEVGQMWKCGK